MHFSCSSPFRFHSCNLSLSFSVTSLFLLSILPSISSLFISVPSTLYFSFLVSYSSSANLSLSLSLLFSLFHSLLLYPSLSQSFYLPSSLLLRVNLSLPHPSAHIRISSPIVFYFSLFFVSLNFFSLLRFISSLTLPKLPSLILGCRLSCSVSLVTNKTRMTEPTRAVVEYTRFCVKKSPNLPI